MKQMSCKDYAVLVTYQAKAKICTKNVQPAEAQESSFASVQGFMELI